MTLYRMKEWFATKVAQEIRHNLSTDEVFAILKETEKAVYAMLAISPNYSKCVWIPKSCLIEDVGSSDFYTRQNISYEEAKDECRRFWSMY